jgi:aminoglycoside 3-N-acetyltransferase
MESAPVLVDGVKKWIEFKNVDLDVFDDFLDVEELFFKKDSDKTVVSNIGDGSALARVFDMKECVDFCTEYYRNK